MIDAILVSLDLVPIIVRIVSMNQEMDIWNAVAGERTGTGVDNLFAAIDMINEKFGGNVPIYETLTSNEDQFVAFFKLVVNIFYEHKNELKDQKLLSYVLFLIGLFKSLDIPVVRRCALRSVSLPLWKQLSASRLKYELDENPHLLNHWNEVKDSKGESLIPSAPS